MLRTGIRHVHSSQCIAHAQDDQFAPTGVHTVVSDGYDALLNALAVEFVDHPFLQQHSRLHVHLESVVHKIETTAQGVRVSYRGLTTDAYVVYPFRKWR